jgi:hypothetical protein
MNLNQKEIENLHQIAINNTGCDSFELVTTENGIGTVTEVRIKVSQYESAVFNITDYECWQHISSQFSEKYVIII